MNITRRKPTHCWAVRARIDGRDRLLSTGCMDEDDARVKAAEMIRDLKRQQLRFKSSAGSDNCRIGDLLRIFEANSLDLRQRTRSDYRRMLLLLLKETGHSITDPATVLTRELVQDWQAKRMERDDSPSARRSCNSILRQARAPFSRRLLSRYPVDLTGFITAPLLRVKRVQYRAPEDGLWERTWEAAQQELTGPELTLFGLCAFAGLRLSEAAAARWDWLHSGWAILIVSPGDGFDTKSGLSRPVPVAPQLQEILRSQSPSGSDHIIPGTDDYRRDKLPRKLNKWLRGKGWTGKKGLHALRGYFGARVATKLGIYSAQKLLGHSDPAITSQYYADLLDVPNVDGLFN